MVRLDPRTQETAAQWLVEKCKTLKCPMCQSEEWEGTAMTSTNLAATPIIGGIKKPPFPEMDVLPLLYIFCKNCAHAVGFSASTMGLTNLE